MDKREFLLALDKMIREKKISCKQLHNMEVFYDIYLSISREAKDFSFKSILVCLEEELSYRMETNYYWCGTDKGPYGFSINTFQTLINGSDEMAHILWAALYRMDDEGNELMEEEEGIMYALDEYRSIDYQALFEKYKEVDDMLDDCEIVNCIYEVNKDILTCAHNMTEILILLELLINSSEDTENVTGSRKKYILVLQSPALDAWVQFMDSGGGNVDKEDKERFSTILSCLENEEIIYETPNNWFDFGSFSTGKETQGGWYHFIVHDEYSLYDTLGVYTARLFAFGIISLRYLVAMVDMQDFLEKMDLKYHYLGCSGENRIADMEVCV